MERLLMVQDALNLNPPGVDPASFYLVGLGAAARMANLKLATRLRRSGITVALELEERSFKAQLRSANKSGARFAVIRGDAELAKGVAVVKSMADGSQNEIPEEELFDFLCSRR